MDLDLESRLQNKLLRASLIGHGITIACLRAGRPVLYSELVRTREVWRTDLFFVFLFFHDYAHDPLLPVQSKVDQDCFHILERKFCPFH